MCLRLACYVIIAIVVALTAIITTLVVNQLLPIISNPNLDITADKLTNILTEIAGQIAPYVIAIIILSILFDLSMLVSFKIKSMKNDTAILEIVVCYVLISFAKIIVYLLPSSIAQLTLLVEISCLACLYYILEDRTTEVISLVSAEEERAPVKNIEAKGPIKEQYNLRQELLDRKYVPGIPSRKTSDEEIERINIIRDYYSRKREMTTGLFYRILLEVVFIVVVAFASGAIFSYNGVVSPWAFVAEIILTGIISFALFYIILGKNLKKIDIISIICLMLGGTLITLNYSFNELPIILLGVFGVLGALAYIVGGARFFFLKKQK